MRPPEDIHLLSGNTMGSNQGAGKEFSTGITYHVLTRSNYSAWSIKMQAVMEAGDLWDMIDPIDTKMPEDAKKNRMARATIFNVIPEDVLFLVAKKESARDVWIALRTMFLGADRVQEARVQSLKEEFENLKMKTSETVEDYAFKVGTIVNKIRELGEIIEDSYVVKRMLQSFPIKFLQIVSSIEQFADLNNMTVEELIGRLKAHEERIRCIGDEDEHIMLTKTHRKAKTEKKNGENIRSHWKKGKWRGRE